MFLLFEKRKFCWTLWVKVWSLARISKICKFIVKLKMRNILSVFEICNAFRKESAPGRLAVSEPIILHKFSWNMATRFSKGNGLIHCLYWISSWIHPVWFVSDFSWNMALSAIQNLCLISSQVQVKFLIWGYSIHCVAL